MKIDLHCHSQHSKRPTLWIMQRLGCPESFTPAQEVYQLARQKGMTTVTLTDHNVIDGALEIAHLPNTFISCEYTTYFPEDRCKVHVLVYGITERQHDDLNRARENIYDLVDYVTDAGLAHACAHPLFGVNDRLTMGHVEQLMLLFKNWEWNGSIDPLMNAAMREAVESLTPERIAALVDKHGICPRYPEPWRKGIVAGSDDHSSLSVADTYTEVPNAANLNEFWAGLAQSQAKVRSHPSSPKQFARHVYGIAYQFYKSKFALERLVPKDLVLRSLDGMLQGRPEAPEPWMNRLHGLFARRRRAKAGAQSERSVLDIIRVEAQELILDDPQLMAIVRDGGSSAGEIDEKWFEFVNQVSSRALVQFGNSLLDRIVKAHFFDIFQSVGSAGALYTLLAPYFVAFSLHTQQRAWSTEVLDKFSRDESRRERNGMPGKLAHFTDTFFEVNGVARTLQQHLSTAQEAGKDYHVLTCLSERQEPSRGLLQFNAVGEFALPEYPELKVLAPPFLQMLEHCYEEEYTHIHVATPGPVGLAGLGIGRILRLPVTGTYHTALPEYAKILTEDAYVEDLMWRCMVWFYNQLDEVYVPSRATGRQLAERGIDASKIRVYPRGCDIERFHPDKKASVLTDLAGEDGEAISVLYVGRVSKEKGLHLLTDAYRALLDKGYSLRLIVVGDGPYMDEMKQELEGTPAVFTGYLDGEELPAIYAECDFLVFPSATDTFGNVVLEAQASGIPVIVTDKGGPHENVVPGETGIVVGAHNVQTLTCAMEELAADDAHRKAMGKAARRYMDRRGFADAFEQLWSMMVETPIEPATGGDAQNPLLDALRGARALAS